MTARHRLYAPHGDVFAVVDVGSTGGGITRGARSPQPWPLRRKLRGVRSIHCLCPFSGR